MKDGHTMAYLDCSLLDKGLKIDADGQEGIAGSLGHRLRLFDCELSASLGSYECVGPAADCACGRKVGRVQVASAFSPEGSSEVTYFSKVSPSMSGIVL